MTQRFSVDSGLLRKQVATMADLEMSDVDFKEEDEEMIDLDLDLTMA